MTAMFKGFEGAVCSAVPMAEVTWFRIGGPAEYFVEPRSFDELAGVLRRCSRGGVPVRILGGGSNVLACDAGVSGAVVRLSKMRAISRSGATITCDAGASLPVVLRRAEAWGLSGLEPLAGIPGSVGGAIAMNAGGRHGTIASVLASVMTLGPGGAVRTRPAAELGLGYRRSRLRGEIVVRAELELTEDDPERIRRRRAAVRDEKARTQPLSARSAGCIFKNPAGRSAGQLIDEAGLKGKRIGRAVVSEKHANFIINEGGASAGDVQALIGAVRDKVHRMFGVDLEPEIDVWN